MAYVIDAHGDPSGPSAGDHGATIVLVGCGGTGGFLAESVCRLLIGCPARLYLVDPDRVEPHNVARQAFDHRDVGRFKAEVLAERFARRFEREVSYSVLPYGRELHAGVFRDTAGSLRLLVGCVDNAAARRAIASTLDGAARAGARSHGCWWLDTGNNRNSGQVLLGNTTRPEALRRAFVPADGRCRALPAPSLQRPDLLSSPPEPTPQPDCAEAVAAAEQGRTINQVVASIAASYVEKLLADTCRWMATYFDLDDGMFRCLPADPKLVADLAGLHLNAVAPPTARR
ncbi:MAG: ThiF family adenylyltransferase [Chloroflexi bacterium]|nr:ThiF family adenylyltransferase [Chloroflexota bacterium]